jgi:hypothetical protein
MFLKIGSRSWIVVLLLATGCKHPDIPARQGESATVPFAVAAKTKPSDSRQLSSVVAQIVAAAHRSGSVIYRVECGPERSLRESDLVPPAMAIEPLQEALNELTRNYPGLKWYDSSDGVRVLDSAVTAGLLRVRISEFTVVEDRGAGTALAALWRTPEVIRYMASHDLRFAHSHRVSQPRRSHGVVVIHLTNATVEQIVQRIAASYPRDENRFWSYRECQSDDETLVEIKIL